MFQQMYVSKPQIEDAIIAKFPPPVSPKAANAPAERRRMPPRPKDIVDNGNTEDSDDSSEGAEMTPRKRNVGSGQKLKT